MTTSFLDDFEAGGLFELDELDAATPEELAAYYEPGELPMTKKQIAQEQAFAALRGARHFKTPEELAKVPIEKLTVVVILVSVLGIRYAQTIEQKKDALTACNEARLDRLLLVWPGKTRSDVFEIGPGQLMTLLEDY